jgi:NADH-quinone oxidoreductase subunit A
MPTRRAAVTSTHARNVPESPVRVRILSDINGSRGTVLTAPLWYVLGFVIAGFSFVFLTIGLSWFISHRHKGDEHKGLPYESGIDTYGDTRGRFGLSFYLYALLFVAFDVEVLFIALWALVFDDVLTGGFMGMLAFIGIMELSVLYAARKGLLTWK